MALGNLLLERRARKMLQRAIIHQDMDGAQQAIAMGARTVDYEKTKPSIYGSVHLKTENPLELAGWNNWSEADRGALAKALDQPLPDQQPVSFLEAVIGEDGIIGATLAQKRQQRMNAKLTRAMLDKDEAAIFKAVEAGATRVDARQTYFMGGTIKRVQDPIELARELGMAGDIVKKLHDRLEQSPRKAPSLGA